MMEQHDLSSPLPDMVGVPPCGAMEGLSEGRDLRGLPAMGVHINGAEKVQAYLHRHGDLSPLIRSACDDLRAEFGSNAQLSLALYNDPEFPDEYLTLVVRLPTYDGETVGRIERICENRAAAWEQTSGHLLITTDFQRSS